MGGGGQRTGSAWRCWRRLYTAAIALSAWALWCGAAFAQPRIAVGETGDFDVKIELSDERIRWGEEFRLTVTARNDGSAAHTGGLYVSFDSDVVVMEVQGGNVLRPGANVFDMRALQTIALTRPMIEVWDETWKAGEERKVTAVVAPLVGKQIRVFARVTLVPDRTKIVTFPSRMQSRALDEAGFPSRVEYMEVQSSSLRRAVRRLESRIRVMEEGDQRRFAAALAAELANPKGFLASSGTVGASPSLLTFLPNVTEQLRKDPLAALENLRCLMVNIECQRAAVYFGVPPALYREMSDAEKAQLDAKRLLGKERGGSELVALIEAEGFILSLAPGNQLTLDMEGKVSTIPVAPKSVAQILDIIVTGLGDRAKKPVVAANGLSFDQLRQQLAQGAPPPAKVK